MEMGGQLSGPSSNRMQFWGWHRAQILLQPGPCLHLLSERLRWFQVPRSHMSFSRGLSSLPFVPA